MKPRKPTVHIFFRHPRPEFNSIEELFDTVTHAFPGELRYKVFRLPYSGASFKAIIGNILYARRNRGTVNHITGDVHYIALGLGKKTVLTIHDAYSTLRGSRLKLFLLKLLWFWLPARKVRSITTISDKSKQELEEVIPFAAKKITVINNPYNPHIHATPLRDKFQQARILFIGTKSNKNLERTIVALKGLQVKLLIVGDLTGEQKRLLHSHVVQYTNEVNVPYKRIVELYETCDLVCFPSLYEGFGMPIVEAHVAGRPVITSNLSPMKEVAGEGGAHLIDPEDIDDIRNAVQTVLHRHGYRQALVKKGSENVQRFSPATIAKAYVAEYLSLAPELIPKKDEDEETT